ncbi:MAG: type II toxin-antitoxin system HicB family antitoxin [Acidobacteria bacterium]|nr:type II toxin-antitoxin system HicB family antitoxin [Acidobacteriota bacterium]
MKNVYTAVIKQDGDWWIGWIEEVPGINCQEATRAEPLESLTITLQEGLDEPQDLKTRAWVSSWS